MSEKKLVALTFDDGPTVGITDRVLDVLEENQVVASFFLIGQQITEETAPLVKERMIWAVRLRTIPKRTSPCRSRVSRKLWMK